jgi:hypothetical protein
MRIRSALLAAAAAAAAAVIAVVSFHPAQAVEETRLPPSCTDPAVKDLFARVVPLWELFETKNQSTDGDKRWCYAYFTGRIGLQSPYMEAIFTLEWVNRSEGRYWLQVRQSGATCRGVMGNPMSRQRCGDQHQSYAVGDMITFTEENRLFQDRPITGCLKFEDAEDAGLHPWQYQDKTFSDTGCTQFRAGDRWKVVDKKGWGNDRAAWYCITTMEWWSKRTESTKPQCVWILL